jgi:hypothetical protein
MSCPYVSVISKYSHFLNQSMCRWDLLRTYFAYYWVAKYAHMYEKQLAEKFKYWRR